MKLIIIGAVAAGTSAAAKASRNDKTAQITIYEKDNYISYSGCGTPYYLGRHFNDPMVLSPRDPAYFKEKYNVEIKINHEVLSVDTIHKFVKVKNLLTGEVLDDSYNKLIMATGAKSSLPPIKGINFKHVFSLRTINDMLAIDRFIQQNNPHKAAIIGTGFIGLELAENFKQIGIGVTLIEKLNQVSPSLDADMAQIVEEQLKAQGCQVLTGKNIIEINEKGVLLEGNGLVSAEIVIVATGVKPNVEIARAANIELGLLGGIKVNDYMETSIQDIYACGDCIEQKHIVSQKPVYRPLGSTANKTGRIAGDNATGGKIAFRGVLGTSIYRIFDLTVAQTGLSEKEARKEGYEIIVTKDSKPHRAEYMDGKDMTIKTIIDQKDGRILGAQIIGEEGVDKRIDVLATAITFQAKGEDLSHLDLAYSPVFSTARDPILQTGMIIEGKMNKTPK